MSVVFHFEDKRLGQPISQYELKAKGSFCFAPIFWELSINRV